MNVASPEQKRRANERLTERIRRLSIGSSLAKKRHKKTKNESLASNSTKH